MGTGGRAILPDRARNATSSLETVSGFCTAVTVAHWNPRICDGTGLASLSVVVNWQRAENLFAETVREVGILVMVFAPLEATFADIPVSTALVTRMFLFGVLLAACGILIESRK